MRTYKKTKVYRGESRFFYAIVMVLVAASVAYAYFLSASVVNVVMRKNIDAQIAVASTKMSDLESNYIELQHSLSADIATQKGFIPTSKKLFVDRTQGTLVLSRN